MKQLIEFIPLVLFFIFFKLYNMYTGIAVLMLASTFALVLNYIIYRHIDKMSLFTYVMVMVFGSFTLYFQDINFFKWKVTIIYAVFAIVFLFCQFVLKKNLIQNILGKEIQLNDTVWQRLNVGWAFFFLFCALLNIYIMQYMSNDAWVNFKTFGLTGLTIGFTLLSGLYIYKNTLNNKLE